MEHIISALIPIFLLILLGYFFQKIKFPTINFWTSADKLTYFILMPSLLVYKLANATFINIDYSKYILSAIFSIIIVYIIMLFLHKIFKYNNASFTSIVQGSIRFNTYVF